MSRSVSLTQQAETFKQETGVACWFLVTIDHTDWGAPIRIVNNEENVDCGGNTYTAFPFELVMEVDDPSRPGEATLTVCNVDQQVKALLDALDSAPEVEVLIVFSNDLANPITMGNYIFRTYSVTVATVEASLAFEDVLNEQIPGGTFTPNHYEGLF